MSQHADHPIQFHSGIEEVDDLELECPIVVSGSDGFHRVESLEGERSLVVPERGHPISAMSDGGTLFFATHEGIRALDVWTGEVRDVCALDGAAAIGLGPVKWTLECNSDGSQVVFMHDDWAEVSESVEGNLKAPPSRLRLLDVGTGALRLLAESEDLQGQSVWMCGVDWDRRCLYVSCNGEMGKTLWRAPFDGDRPELLTLLPSSGPLELSRTGKYLVVGHPLSDTFGLRLVDLESDDLQWQRITSFGGTASWSPVADHIAYYDLDDQLHFYDTATQTTQPLFSVAGTRIPAGERFGSRAKACVWSPSGNQLTFGLTWRLDHDEVVNPRALELKDSFWAQNEYQRHMYERLAHRELHQYYGVLDIARRKVWVREGYWREHVWCPKQHTQHTSTQPRLRCPKCAWIPYPLYQWTCAPAPGGGGGCNTEWHTFDTRGRCPGCGHQWADTDCPACHQKSPHEDWYAPEDDSA